MKAIANELEALIDGYKPKIGEIPDADLITAP